MYFLFADGSASVIVSVTCDHTCTAFDEAISHYDFAIELDNQDISFITNKCAACFPGCITK